VAITILNPRGIARRPKMILFDLDGTMVDSAPDLAYCVDSLLPDLGLPQRGEAAIRLWIGNGIERLLHRALTNDLDGIAAPSLFNAALPKFLDLYAVNIDIRSRIYPGVEDGLRELQALGISLACVTNKMGRFARPLLQQLQLAQYFPLVVTGDNLPEKKPSPVPLLYAANYFRTPVEYCLMVGDSLNDINAARAAQFSIICVSYGYNHGRDIRASFPDAVIDSFADLVEVIATAII